MSIDQEIDNRKLALSGLNSQQLANRLKQSGGLLDALAAQKLISEKEAYKRNFAMQMEQSPKTIAQKNEDKIKQLSQIDVAQGVAGVLQNRKKRSDANAKMLASIDPRKLKAITKKPMGLPSAPVPRVQKAAQGGIVGFQAGNEVIGLSGARNNNPFVRDISERDPTFKSLAQQFPNNPVLGEVPEMAEPGAIIAEAGSDVANWIMSNPAEAIALGITSFPAVRGAKMAFNVSKSAFNTIKNIITKYPKTALGIGATGTFVGQDAINEMVQNLPETMVDVGKGIANIPSLARKGYEGVRDFMEFESPGLLTPDVNTTSPSNLETTSVDAEPTTAPESVRDAQRMMDINKIPVAEDRMPLEERLKEIDKSKEEKPTIPKINGGESPNQLNQKEEVINSNLDELAIRLSKFARSDPRKPGGYTAASFQRDQEILTEKQKAQALRMKQRELDIRADLNNIRREQLTQNYFTTRLASLDKSIIDAMELFRESPLYMSATNEIATLTQALKKEQEKGGIFGFGGPDEEKIKAIQADIKEQKDIIKVGETELTGNFLAERNALSNKYTELYTNYTGDDSKEDFNLKDQRTVGQ